MDFPGIGLFFFFAFEKGHTQTIQVAIHWDCTGPSVSSAPSVTAKERVRGQPCSRTFCVVPCWLPLDSVTGPARSQSDRALRDWGYISICTTEPAGKYIKSFSTIQSPVYLHGPCFLLFKLDWRFQFRPVFDFVLMILMDQTGFQMSFKSVQMAD